MSTNSIPYPFKVAPSPITNDPLPDVRGRFPSVQASRLRSMWLKASRDPNEILAFPTTYDGLTSRLVAEADFPLIFLAGLGVASAHGLPDTGYIAVGEMCEKIQEASRMVDIPIMADGDTGYGNPLNVKRTVKNFVEAGAAGVMIEDQTWPKRCGHTKGKSVVSRGEAYARVKSAADARDEGKDVFILARTDSLILGYDEAITRAREFMKLGADAVFIEALPDRATMERCARELEIPLLANIIEGGLTENLSAKELASMGFAAVAYPWTLAAAHIRSVRETLNALKKSLSVGPPPMILSYDEMMDGLGFRQYWEEEERYRFDEKGLIDRENVPERASHVD